MVNELEMNVNGVLICSVCTKYDSDSDTVLFSCGSLQL